MNARNVLRVYPYVLSTQREDHNTTNYVQASITKACKIIEEQNIKGTDEYDRPQRPLTGRAAAASTVASSPSAALFSPRGALPFIPLAPFTL